MDIKIGIIKGSFPQHMHQCYEIIICTKGRGIFNTDDTKINVSPGTIIIVPPSTTHYTSSDSDCERIYISGEFSQILSIPSTCVFSDNAEGESTFLAKMIYRNRFRNNEYITSLINAFIHCILQNIETDNEINYAIKNIINQITDRFFDSNINISSLLQKSGYSEDYIRAKFKKLTDKTPISFLTEIRISHACFLMDVYKKSLPLAEIAEKCGLTDYVYFSRQFKKVKGMSPREYMTLAD